jgi:hypothetical protein
VLLKNLKNQSMLKQKEHLYPVDLDQHTVHHQPPVFIVKHNSDADLIRLWHRCIEVAFAYT